MRRLLHGVSGIQTLLRSGTVLWSLSGVGECCGLRSAVLPRSGILVGPHVLRLEAWPLGVPKRSENLETRSLRRARILIRNQGRQLLAAVGDLDTAH